MTDFGSLSPKKEICTCWLQIQMVFLRVFCRSGNRGSGENTHHNLRFWQTRLPGWCCGCAHRNKAMPERVPAAVKLKLMAIWKTNHPKNHQQKKRKKKTESQSSKLRGFFSGPQLLLPMRPSNPLRPSNSNMVLCTAKAARSNSFRTGLKMGMLG